MPNNILSTKPHYPVLDGLRGVAAIMVVAFHLCEAHAANRFVQVINHGYLAVDFFFLLSGFVIGYAYDDRWGKMKVGNFFTRRLVRLQPMVIMGMVIGAICFYWQDSVVWPGIHEIPAWKVLLVMVIGFTLIPLPVSMDIRGWNEMHPLDGPGWSLFYEYIANILYAIGIRKFSKTALLIFVVLAGAALIHFTLTGPSGDVIGGWSLEWPQIRIGLTRMLYPFFAGLLLSRVIKISQVKNGFLWCSLFLIIILSIPRIGGTEKLWMNGLYESLSIIFLFPLIVWLGAGSKVKNPFAIRICKFFGDISYPVYITHYPLIYIYTGWANDHKKTLNDALPVTILVFSGILIIAYACLKLYDEPVRKWLHQKFLVK